MRYVLFAATLFTLVGAGAAAVATPSPYARPRLIVLTDIGGDPDKNALSYRWWVYPEAGTYGVSASLHGADKAEASLTVPADAAGKAIHVILEVSDQGEPPLTTARRVVIDMGSERSDR